MLAPQLTSQSNIKKAEPQFICYYPAFQRYAAAIVAPYANLSHTHPRFKKPGYRLQRGVVTARAVI